MKNINSFDSFNQIENAGDVLIFNKPQFSIDEIKNGIISSEINKNFELFTTFSLYYDLVCSMFTFENLPSFFTSEIFNKVLIEYGALILAKKGDEYFFAPLTNVHDIVRNESGEVVEISINPNNYSVFGFGNLQNSFSTLPQITLKNTQTEKEFAIFKTSPSNIPLIWYIFYYSMKLVELENAIENNIFALQQPLIFTGSKEHKLDVLKMFEKFTNKVRAFFVKRNESLSNSKIEVIDTNAKNYIEFFEKHKDYVKGELFENLGINSTPYEKKERLIVDEVNSNNELVEMVRNIYYTTLKECVENCNKFLDTNIVLKFNFEKIGGVENDTNNEIINNFNE